MLIFHVQFSRYIVSASLDAVRPLSRPSHLDHRVEDYTARFARRPIAQGNLLKRLHSTIESGGPKWTRTTDLTIISRVL